MTASDRTTLLRKLGYLQANLPLLDEYRHLDKATILENREKFFTVTHLLQTTVESVLDCAQLLVLIEDWRPARSDAEAIALLAAHSVIPDDLCKRLLGAKGFRNLVVHEYAKVDPEKVYENLQKGFVDLEAFAKCLARYLEAQKAGG